MARRKWRLGGGRGEEKVEGEGEGEGKETETEEVGGEKVSRADVKVRPTLDLEETNDGSRVSLPKGTPDNTPSDSTSTMMVALGAASLAVAIIIIFVRKRR